LHPQAGRLNPSQPAADQSDSMRNGFRKLTVPSQALATDERGFALATVLFMLLAAFATVSVGVFATIQAQSGGVRDQDTKASLAAAEAGVTQALLHYNSNITAPEPCLMPNGDTGALGYQATDSSGWCQAVETPTASYRVCPRWSEAQGTCMTSGATGTMAVVSTGSTNGVLRRIEVVANSVSGQQVFLNAGIRSQTDINLDSNAGIHSTTSAGGNITLDSNASQCGLATVGPSGSISGHGTYYENPDCSGTPLSTSSVTHQTVTLPPVNQGNANQPGHNDNYRITNAITGAATPADLISGNKADVAWDPTTRQLTINGNTSLTLTGQTYSLCKLVLNSNAALYIAAGQKANIFFDSPESCALPYDDVRRPQLGITQMQLSSNSRVTPTTGTPASIGIYFVGSQSKLTNAVLSSNTDISGSCVQNFVIYGPYTHIELLSNSQYCGALAGQSIHMNSNAHFYTDDASKQIVLPGTLPHYTQSKFLECTAEASSVPTAGC
jgi:hypothetical protein